MISPVGIVTALFLATLVSYYVLLLLPARKAPVSKKFDSITVIIPAHNEQEYIADCIKSVQRARFHGKKQIVVVDDGSADRTAEIAGTFKGVRLLRTAHSGKSASLNLALGHAMGELIAVVDADSTIEPGSLLETAREAGRKNTAAATCIVKVKNRRRILCIWPHIEFLYNSLIRSILSKVNANITTPGPLSVYRKSALREIGGFSTEGFSEDVDVTIRLIRKGYSVGFTEKAVAYTNLPYDLKGFLRQRFRFGRGLLNILRRHLQINRRAIDIYTLPLFLFAYVQAVVMGSFTIYQIASGYWQWFASKGVLMSTGVLVYFFNWASVFGFARWLVGIVSASEPLTWISLFGIVSTLLSYPLFIYAVLRYDRKIDIYHIVSICFMAPFWWALMVIYILSLPEMFRKRQYNIWLKNE